MRHERDFAEWAGARLAWIPGVIAVTLGGSRAFRGGGAGLGGDRSASGGGGSMSEIDGNKSGGVGGMGGFGGMGSGTGAGTPYS